MELAPFALSNRNASLAQPKAAGEVGAAYRLRFIPLLLSDTRDQCVRRGIGQLVEPALQGGSRRLGIKARRGDALVAEKTLQIGNVHAQREQPGRHRVAQQMWVDALRSKRSGRRTLASRSPRARR